MSASHMVRRSALYWAAGLGVLADLLVRVQGRPGIGVALWAIVAVRALALLLKRGAHDASRESWYLLGGAVSLAIALTLRDADALAVFTLLAAVALVMLAAGRAGARWLSRAQPSAVVFAVLRVVVLCVAGPFGWGRSAGDSASAAAKARADKPSGWSRPLRTLLRGTAMALPALVVLTALLMSADEVFARLLQRLLVVDVEPLVQHVAFSAAIAWLTAGYLRSFLIRDELAMNRLRVPQLTVPVAEVSVALWLLNLLFLAFMAVQLRYLFGGAALIEVTAALTYATYARRGFFELVATAALVVPILLLADWATVPGTPRSRRLLRATMATLVVLLVGVIASAAYRMRLYQEAYGLTELRLYVSVVIVWLTAVLGWLVLTVLRGQRERFASGCIIGGVTCLIGLYAINPHALIATVNIDRAVAGATYDGTYLQSLSADAVPVLVTRLPQLPAAEQCRVVQMLETRWRGERPGGWRTWNVSDARARRLVALRPQIPSCST